MPQVLLAVADPGLTSELARLLPVLSIQVATSPDSLFEGLGTAELLVLDDQFVAETTGLVSELRSASPELPLIYCLDPASDARLVRRLVLDLRVNELLFRPIDYDALARGIASQLGMSYSTPCASETDSTPPSVLQRKLAEAWSRVRSRMIERVDVLESASAALAEDRLDARLRQQACAEAHKLAGSLGTFGIPAGSRLARELEVALEDSNSNTVLAATVAETAAALRLEIERSPALQDAGRLHGRDGELAPVLLISPDEELSARLIEEATARRWFWQRVAGIDAAPTVLADLNPGAILIDTETGPACLDFLAGLESRVPRPTAIILTSSSGLMDRVEVARRGGRGFFLRTLPAAEIVDTIQALLDRLQARARVLAVDDDPAVREALQALLGSGGVELTTLGDPLELWDKLEGSPPDLLLLDVEMPNVNGIELCRVIRNDPRWAAIPVMFLTALTDAEAVRRVFAAGADDYVTKPIVGPELLSRIGNRLDRTRLLRRIAELDQLTGLPNRLKCRHALADFLRLADRHGQPMGLAILQVDDLRRVNERCGAGTGDEVLRELGRCLRNEFRSEEVAGRWSGNEFVLGLYGLNRQASLHRLEDPLRAFALRGSAHPRVAGCSPGPGVTLSGGVAGYPEDGSDLDTLLAEAAGASGRAAAAGGNQLLAATAGREGSGPRAVDLAVVSSDEANTTLLAHALQSEGYHTRVLRSGLTAERALRGPEPSLRARLLLIDADLPGVDTLNFISQLKAEGILEHAAAIVLSSGAAGHEIRHVLESGAADLIPKPVDAPVLLDRIRHELERPESR